MLKVKRCSPKVEESKMSNKAQSSVEVKYPKDLRIQ